MTKKERIVKKAKELKVQYRKYVGCSVMTFAAVVDAFRSEGIELFTPEVEEQIFKECWHLREGPLGRVSGLVEPLLLAPSLYLTYRILEAKTSQKRYKI